MQNDNYKTFMDAVINNDVETVERYLKIVDPSAKENFAIRMASVNGHIKVVRLLLSDPRVDPSEYQNWAIRTASGNGHLEVVRLLLFDKRVDPSAGDNWAIRMASYNGHIEVVKLLLSDPRVDPSADNNWAIQMASKNGHIEVVKLLLQDDRVKFDAIANEKMKQQLLREKEERKKLQKEWVSAYQSIEKTSPQVSYEGKLKSQIPKEIIKKTIYQSTYQELCESIHGNIPPVKLLALADLLKIEYDRNTSYTELCGKVKFVLLNRLT